MLGIWIGFGQRRCIRNDRLLNLIFLSSMKNFIHQLEERCFLSRFEKIEKLASTSIENQVRWFKLVQNDDLRLKALRLSYIDQKAIREMWSEYFHILAPYITKANDEQFKLLLEDETLHALKEYVDAPSHTLSDDHVSMLVRHIGFRMQGENNAETKGLLDILYAYIARCGVKDEFVSERRLNSYPEDLRLVICEAECAYLLNKKHNKFTDLQFKTLLLDPKGSAVRDYFKYLVSQKDKPLSLEQLQMFIDSICLAETSESKERTELLLDALYSYVRTYGFPMDLKISGKISTYPQAVAEKIRTAETANYHLSVVTESREIISSKIRDSIAKGYKVTSANVILGSHFIKLMEWLKDQNQELAVDAQKNLDYFQYVYYSNLGLKLSDEAAIDIVGRVNDTDYIVEIFKRENISDLTKLYDVLCTSEWKFYEFQKATMDKKA
jgi:hypothetical protein